jgi:hypothetical protein
MSLECNVCYANINNIISCFNGCSFVVCRPCFKRLIQLHNSDVCYTCPMCRDQQIYQKSPRFTRLMNKSRDLLKKIIDLTYIQSRTEIEWCRYVYEEFPIFQAYMGGEYYNGIRILSPPTGLPP